MESSVYEFEDYTQVLSQNIKFMDVGLWDITFHFNKKNQFSKWRAESYTMRGDKKYLIDQYKKSYNLKEKKDANDKFYLTGYPEQEAILITIFPDKIKFNIQNFDYSLADHR